MNIKNKFKKLLEQISNDNRINKTQTDFIVKESQQNTLSFEQKLFNEQIQRKIDKLNIRQHILRFKYSSYKKSYDITTIIVIILSSLLTVFEAVKSEFNLKTGVFQLVPIFISSTVAFIATFSKFKKYQEKMETMARCLERCISIIFRLTRIQEHAYHVENLKQLLELKKIYMGEPYENYIGSREEIEKNLKFKELVRHMETYREYVLRFQDSEAKYRYEKKKINNKLNQIDKMLRNNQEYIVEGHSQSTLDVLQTCWDTITRCRSNCCSKKNTINNEIIDLEDDETKEDDISIRKKIETQTTI